MSSRLIFSGIITSVFMCTAFEAATLIHAGRMLDMTSNKLQKEMTLVIEADRIQSIQDGYSEPGKEDVSV